MISAVIYLIVRNISDLFNLQNTSKVSTTDKWIIYKFGTAGKYKSYKDVPDRVKYVTTYYICYAINIIFCTIFIDEKKRQLSMRQFICAKSGVRLSFWSSDSML